MAARILTDTSTCERALHVQLNELHLTLVQTSENGRVRTVEGRFTAGTYTCPIPGDCSPAFLREFAQMLQTLAVKLSDNG